MLPETYSRSDLAAGVLGNTAGQSTVYVFGGRFKQPPSDPPATTILAYDVATDSWTIKAAHFTGAATNGVGKIGGLLYISGGWDFTGTPDHWVDVSARLLAYNPVSDRLLRKADMPAATAEGVTGVINGKLYVLAGRCFQQTCRKFYRYDPAKNAWTTLPSAPNNHRRGAGVVIGGKFYVAAGGFQPFTSFDVYDPVTNAWKILGTLPFSREFAVGAPLQSKVYVVGIGGDDTTRESDRNMYAYDPATKTWTNVDSYPGPVGEDGQFLLRPSAAVRVFLDGSPHLLALGSGHFNPDGTIIPAPPYLFTP
jgi:N-acetylneuraminic acid mutarotase